MDQRSPEWFAERMGRITSTSAKVIINPSARPDSSATLMGELVREIATGDYKDVPDTFWMRHGREQEPKAIAAYEMYTGVKVQDGGFHISDRHNLMGDSPDGVVGLFEGVVEAKCPSPEEHGRVLVQSAPKPEHRWQMAWHLMVSGALWCDYVSYCDEYPEHLKLFIKRYTLLDIWPDKIIKGKIYKSKPDISDKVITSAEQIGEAWGKIGNFIDTYQGHLQRLGLTLE